MRQFYSLPARDSLLFFFAVSLAIAVSGFWPAMAQTTGWQWVHPRPNGHSLNDVDMVDSLVGYIAGDFGTLKKTTDGGLTWTDLQSGTHKDLKHIQFASRQVGWAAGQEGALLKTTDGGLSWVHHPQDSMFDVSALFVLNEQTAWFSLYSGANAPGHLFKTTNGGDSWSLVYSQTNGARRSLFFLNDTLGWSNIISSTSIYRTINGGATWQASPSLGLFYSGRLVRFVNDTLGIAIGTTLSSGGTVSKGAVCVSTNSGVSWGPLFEFGNDENHIIFDMALSDSNTAWMVGELGRSLKTPVQPIALSSTGNFNSLGIKELSLYGVDFGTPKTGIVVGAAGLIVRTANSGTTWTMISEPQIQTSLVASSFIDATTGWVTGIGHKAFKTTDRGLNWTPVAIFESPQIYSEWNGIQFLDPLHGCIHGWYGDYSNPYPRLTKTSDGGATWQSLTLPFELLGPGLKINQTKWFSLQSAWMHSGKYIFRTSNGAGSWSKVFTNPTAFTLQFAAFPDENTAFICRSNNTILRTRDGGLSWSKVDSVAKAFAALGFMNRRVGYYLLKDGSLFRTTNGGNSWVGLGKVPGPDTTSRLTSLGDYYNATFHFPERGKIFLVTWTRILRSLDGGVTWTKEDFPSNKRVNLSTVNKRYIWGVGTNGAIFLKDDQQGTYETATVKGNVFRTQTGSCNPATATPLPGQVIQSSPDPYFAISDSAGNYQLEVPVGPDTITWTARPVNTEVDGFSYTLHCPQAGSHVFSLDSVPVSLYNKDFGFTTSACHQLEVEIGSLRRRRCFKQYTTISYRNKGHAPAFNAYVVVDFPHWVRPLMATRPHVVVNDSTWHFPLDTLSPGENGTFTLTDSVLCSLLPTQRIDQCTRASIYPPSNCTANPNWNGSEVTISGTCANGLITLRIFNRTAIPMADSVDFSVFLDSAEAKYGRVKLAAGDSLLIQVTASGHSVYFSVDQVAHHPTIVFAALSFASCLSGMTTGPDAGSILFPVAQNAFSRVHCMPVTGSYDPNDKQVFPQGFTENHLVPTGTELYYQVRFQNTGTDTAFTVFIVDTLHRNLDPLTFEASASSHPHVLTMRTTPEGKTIVRWDFDNIDLPDSNRNEPGSHGFVSFRISPKAGLTPGSQAQNVAAIYFDFNPPVLTNLTQTTFDNIPASASLSQLVQVVTSMNAPFGGHALQVFPNPFTGKIRVQSSLGNEVTVQVVDVFGRELHTSRFQSTAELSLGHLPEGIYYLRFPQLHQCHKVVKTR